MLVEASSPYKAADDPQIRRRSSPSVDARLLHIARLKVSVRDGRLQCTRVCHMVDKRSPLDSAEPSDSAELSGRDWPQAWPPIILASTLAAAAVSILGLPPAIRAPVVLWFAAICPGLSIVRLLHLDDRLIELVLAVALSLSLDGIVAAAFLYSGHWSPVAIMASLMAITVGALALESILSVARRRRGTRQ